jgi:PPOX class probable F420-dependent enzyme
MNRRAQIRMTAEAQADFLRTAPKASLATIGQDGFPHVVAMSFLAQDGRIYMTSYGKAQKVLNIRRNPHVGIMIETGSRYDEYRGVMIRGRCEVIEDPAQVAAIMRASRDKASAASSSSREEALSRAPKRVLLKVTPEKVTSWDHTKLGGRY